MLCGAHPLFYTCRALRINNDHGRLDARHATPACCTRHARMEPCLRTLTTVFNSSMQFISFYNSGASKLLTIMHVVLSSSVSACLLGVELALLDCPSHTLSLYNSNQVKLECAMPPTDPGWQPPAASSVRFKLMGCSPTDSRSAEHDCTANTTIDRT